MFILCNFVFSLVKEKSLLHTFPAMVPSASFHPYSFFDLHFPSPDSPAYSFYGSLSSSVFKYTLKSLQKQPSSTCPYTFLISFTSYPFKLLVYSHSLELTSLTLSSLVFSHFTPQELLSKITNNVLLVNSNDLFSSLFPFDFSNTFDISDYSFPWSSPQLSSSTENCHL